MLQHWPQGPVQHILRFNTCEYMHNTCQIHTKIHANTYPQGETLYQNLIHAITFQIHADACQYIPQYILNTYQYWIGAAYRFSPQGQRIHIGMYFGMYWYVLCKYLACIMKLYQSIVLNTSSYINTHHNMQYRSIHTMQTNTCKNRPIHIIAYNPYQYIPISI